MAAILHTVQDLPSTSWQHAAGASHHASGGWRVIVWLDGRIMSVLTRPAGKRGGCVAGRDSNRHLHADGSTSVSLCASRGGGELTCPLLGAKTVAVACPRWRGLAQSCLARCLCQNRGGCAEKETRRARAWPQQARADHSPSASDTMLCIEHPLASARSRTSCQHVPRSLPARARPRGKPWRQHRCDHARLKHQIPSGWPVRREASGPGPRPLLPGAPQRGGGGLIGSALRTAGL